VQNSTIDKEYAHLYSVLLPNTLLVRRGQRMRPDMAKVVTEKPRRGHGNKSEKHGGRLHRHDIDRALDDDDCFDDDLNLLPVRAGHSTSKIIPWSRHRNIDNKDFSDLIGPLRGYLRKQRGRHWDDVYSELSRTLDKRSISGSHIWDHIKQEITMETWMGVSGTIYERRRYGGDMPVSGLYVHPFTRRVCEAPDLRYRYNAKPHQLYQALVARGFALRWERQPATMNWRGEVKENRDPMFVEADWQLFDTYVLQRVKGCWFIHQFERFDPMEVVDTVSLPPLKGETEPRVFTVRRYQRPKLPLWRKVRTRQLGKRELKALAKADVKKKVDTRL
jgi:hypothetical protein